MTDLKAVFDALDTQNRGYITLNEFKQSFHNFFLSHGSSSEKEKQLNAIIQEISPNADDKVSFDSFSYGIQQIMRFSDDAHVSLQSAENSAIGNSSLDPYPSEQLGLPSTPLGLKLSLSNPDASEDLTTTDGLPPRPDSARSAAKRLLNRNGVQAEPLCSARPPSHPSSASMNREGIRSTWPKRRQSVEPPGMDGGGGAGLTGDASSSYRRHRRTDSASSFASSLAGSRSDLYHGGDTESTSGRLQEQLYRLTQKLETLTVDQTTHDQRHHILKEENRSLLDRVHQLEELLRESELRSSQMIQAEKEKFQQKLMASDREHHTEVDRMRSKLYALEKEISELRVESATHRGEAEKHKWGRDLLQEKLSECERKNSELQTALDSCREQSKAEMERLRSEREHSEHRLEKLNQEVAGLRAQGTGGHGGLGTVTGSNGVHLGVSDLHARYREVQDLVRTLTTENKSLREQLSEAQEEIMCSTVAEGRRLIGAQETSLAAELDNYSKDELMEMLVKEKDANYKLRDYIDKIISRVIEKQPSLLEIEHK